MLSYINDGYTADGYIEEIPRLHQALRFTYRPVLPADRGIYMAEIEKATPRGKEEFRAEIIRRHVPSWDMKNGDEAVPLHKAAILHVHPALFTRLYLIVMGYDAPDAQPDATKLDTLDVAAQLDAALAGTTPVEADAKN